MYRFEAALRKSAAIIGIIVSTILLSYWSLLMFYTWDSFISDCENNAETFISLVFENSKILWLCILCLAILFISAYLFQNSLKKEHSAGSKILYDVVFFILLFLLGIPIMLYSVQNRLYLFVFILLIIAAILMLIRFLL